MLSKIFPKDFSAKEIIKFLIIILSLSAAIFHLYIALTGVIEAYKLRTLHLMFLLPLSFLLKPMKKSGKFSKVGILDIIIAIIMFLSIYYLSVLHYDRLIDRLAYIDSLYLLDLVCGVIIIIGVLEATRRFVGMSMVYIALIAMAYALYGNYIPGIMGHSGSSPIRLIETMTLSTEAIFGLTTSASATFIFLFVLFGEFLNKSGAGQFFIDIAYALTGNSKGGPAKMAVVSSCLMGSISGSSTANVTSTGAYTIPLMKKMGYENEFAGAVEASASTGGGIMPPVMGSCAFLMAEYVGIPYIALCTATIVPAILYFTSVGFTVHFEATRLGLRGLKEETESAWSIFKKKGYLSIPLIVIIITMIKGFSPYKAALYGIISCIVISYLNKETAITPKKIYECLVTGAKSAVMIAITCATAGIVIGVTSDTGIAVKFASIVINIFGGNIFFILPMIMIASLILGMGLPASAAYIMVAAISVPTLVKLNLNLLASHLFALYFGVFSGITPPVAIAAFAAAGLAEGKPVKTGFKAVLLSLPAFIIPYVFIFKNGLLLIGTGSEIFSAIAATLIGSIFISTGIVGCIYEKIHVLVRVVILASSIVLMISSNLLVQGVSLVILLAIFFTNRVKSKKAEVVQL